MQSCKTAVQCRTRYAQQCRCDALIAIGALYRFLYHCCFCLGKGGESTGYQDQPVRHGPIALARVLGWFRLLFFHCLAKSIQRQEWSGPVRGNRILDQRPQFTNIARESIDTKQIEQFRRR